MLSETRTWKKVEMRIIIYKILFLHICTKVFWSYQPLISPSHSQKIAPHISPSQLYLLKTNIPIIACLHCMAVGQSLEHEQSNWCPTPKSYWSWSCLPSRINNSLARSGDWFHLSIWNFKGLGGPYLSDHLRVHKYSSPVTFRKHHSTALPTATWLWHPFHVFFQGVPTALVEAGALKKMKGVSIETEEDRLDTYSCSL